jgi:hypothetical protein
MKKLFLGTLLLVLVIGVSISPMARAEINVSIVLPPPIVFSAPPELIVLPDTYIYVVPDIDEDIFFYDGWWWRQWEGRWYRSYYYDRGWDYYNDVPSFYFDVDPGWRGYYRDHSWYGHQWNYDRIPNQRLQQNWKGWQNDRHWEKQGTWGVKSYQPRPQRQMQELRQQRQQQYQQRPEVQKQKQSQVQQPKQQHQEKVQQPQRPEPKPQVQEPKQQHQEKVQQSQRPEPKPQVQEPKLQHQEKVQQPQRQEQRPQDQEPRQQAQPQGKPERGEVEKQDRR